jgi:recombinational DNA repair protein RecT
MKETTTGAEMKMGYTGVNTIQLTITVEQTANIRTARVVANGELLGTPIGEDMETTLDALQSASELATNL